MKALRSAVVGFLVVTGLAAIAPELWAPVHYAAQDRESPDAPPSRNHLLGTDPLGRDRFSRLVYGTRVSMALAPAAALISCVIAGLLGGVAALSGPAVGWGVLALADLFLSLPWLLLLLTVRAFLPLNVSPAASVTITFGLLAVLGWAGPARVVFAGVREIRDSDFVVYACATGCNGRRLLWSHVGPNLKDLLWAQFWVAVPAYVLAEATLGMLGLGVAEPLPSWGSLLRELQGASVTEQPWLLAPVVLLALVVGSFQFLAKQREAGATEESA